MCLGPLGIGWRPGCLGVLGTGNSWRRFCTRGRGGGSRLGIRPICEGICGALGSMRWSRQLKSVFARGSRHGRKRSGVSGLGPATIWLASLAWWSRSSRWERLNRILCLGTRQDQSRITPCWKTRNFDKSRAAQWRFWVRAWLALLIFWPPKVGRRRVWRQIQSPPSDGQRLSVEGASGLAEIQWLLTRELTRKGF